VTSAGGPRTLAGRYRLDEVIGRGGMSTVYRGTDLALDRVVAVKVALDPLVEQSPIYLARFTREAQAAAAIGNPGVVTVYDAGADGPTRFIVMEFVPGRSLADILAEREHKPLEPERAANIAAQVAGALNAAHAAGIIHRDIKPGNIMVEPDGAVKVLDFGIARALDSHTLTQTATVLGTSAYMSPEQAMGQPVDARSDIYSLGCVLYEMLTGEPPFIGEVSAAVLHQHVRVEPKPARVRNPAIPPALGDLVMEMLAKKPKDRPQTAAEVRDRLRQALADPDPHGDDDALTTIAMAAAMAPTPATVPIEAAETTPETAPVPTPDPTGATVPLAARLPDRPPPGNRARTTGPSPPPKKRGSATGFWITVFVVAAALLGGAVAVALSAGGSNGTTSSGHSAASDTGAQTSSETTTSPPQSQTSTSSTTAPPQSTSTSTPTSTSTTTTSTTAPKTTTSSPTITTTSAPTTSTGAATTGTTSTTSP